MFPQCIAIVALHKRAPFPAVFARKGNRWDSNPRKQVHSLPPVPLGYGHHNTPARWKWRDSNSQPTACKAVALPLRHTPVYASTSEWRRSESNRHHVPCEGTSLALRTCVPRIWKRRDSNPQAFTMPSCCAPNCATTPRSLTPDPSFSMRRENRIDSFSYSPSPFPWIAGGGCEPLSQDEDANH